MTLKFKQLLELLDQLSKLEAKSDCLKAGYASDRKNINDQIRQEKRKQLQQQSEKPYLIREVIEKIDVLLKEIKEERV